MGCFGNKPDVNYDEDKRRSSSTLALGEADQRRLKAEQKKLNSSIDYFLGKEKEQEKGKLKILLLGAGESGKSTIFKQFRNLYGTPRSDDDKKKFGVVIRSNIISAVTKLCELTRELGCEESLIRESDNANSKKMTVKDAYDLLVTHLVDNDFTEALPDISPEHLAKDWVGFNPRAGSKCNLEAVHCVQLVDVIEIFWQSPTIQKVWIHRAKKNINDSHATFINDVRRIVSTKYIPTEDDILKARIRTTQISHEQYNIDGTDVNVCDVGGQRAERRKWIHCFDDVDAVIFVAALSEYDQKLSEAKKDNRMVEAIKLFGNIVKNPSFQNKPILLFLNKKDIFQEKIKHSDIADVPHFNDFNGVPNDANHGVYYFIQQFEREFESELTNKYIHITNATDTANMEFVLNAARMLIMEKVFNETPLGAADDCF